MLDSVFSNPILISLALAAILLLVACLIVPGKFGDCLSMIAMVFIVALIASLLLFNIDFEWILIVISIYSVICVLVLFYKLRRKGK